MPQVSIIMPCHNGEKYLSDSINSVLAQTFTDWELLIIDDNSSDNSVKIIESFCAKDTRIRLFHTDRSTGLPATPRNVGIQNASGRYIAFLDCDDMWLPAKLEHQLPLFESDDVAVIFSYYEKINVCGLRNNRIVTAPHAVNYATLLNGNCIGNLTAVYDTQKVGKIYQKEIHHEDYLMWLTILLNDFKAINTKTVEALYREQINSVSGSKLSVFLWQWHILRNELKLPLFKAIPHFMAYIYFGIKKYLK